MPIIGAIVLLIQFSFAYHVFKTGRPYWWVFVIMAFPVMGCVIYYLVEMFPGSRDHRKVHQATRKLVKALQPDAELKRRAEELEVCGSVDNKMALAEECFNHQMYDEAVRLYESCLQGAFSKDGILLFGLARAAAEGQAWDKAVAALQQLKTEAPKVRSLEAHLLEARVLAGRGQTDAALAAYRDLIPVFVGLEARYRYGALLLERGQLEAANQMFNEVIAHAKRFPAVTESEQQWLSAARRAISNR